MLYAILCYNDEDVVGSWTKEEDDACMARLMTVQEKLHPARPARPGRAAAADHRGDDAAQGQGRAAGHRRPVRRDQGAVARLLHGRLCRRSTRRSTFARELAEANPGGGSYEIRPVGSSIRGRFPHDRHGLDRPGADRRPPAGGGSAAALFPRPRHGRGGVPGRLPAGAEDLAAERPAARSGGLADLRRPQRRHRRGAPQRPQPAAAGRTDAVRSRRRRGARSPSGSTAPTIATTSCGCCSSAAIPTCRRRSRSRWRCASSRACRSSRSRAPSWSARAPWSSASPAPRRRSRRPACRSRRRARSSAPSASPPWRPWSICVFNEGYSASGGDATDAPAALRRGDPAGAAAAAAVPGRAGDHGPGRADAAAACARARRASTPRAPSSCWRTRTAACGTAQMIAEGLALIDKAMRHRRPGPYQIQAAIAALHARAKRPEDTDWAQIDLLYGALETAAAVAGGHAQPRRRGVQGARPGSGAGDDRAAGAAGCRAISISSASRAGC